MRAASVLSALLLLSAACGATTPARVPDVRADAWLNGTPPGELRGRVLLVEFWTFG